MSEWISVDDELPERGVYVLTYAKNRTINFRVFSGDGFWLELWGYKFIRSRVKVTHWMPLPQPPQSKE